MANKVPAGTFKGRFIRRFQLGVAKARARTDQCRLRLLILESIFLLELESNSPFVFVFRYKTRKTRSVLCNATNNSSSSCDLLIR